MTLREALSKSVNTVAVQVAQEVGVRNVIRTAQRLGIQETMSPNLSLALGTCSVNLVELTAAYAAFANGGYGVIPHGIEEVRTERGEQIYQRSGSGLGRVMSEDALGEMNDMLKAVMIEGTGRKAALPGRPSAGKTGTSQDFRDAWFVGFTADLVVGIWVGNDDGKPMKKVTGGSLPATIWHDFMIRTQKDIRVADLPGAYPASALSVAPAQDGAGPAQQEQDGTQDRRVWEEPGFFERLFGSGGAGEPPASSIAPGHPGDRY